MPFGIAQQPWANLRLEASAAAGLVAIEPFLAARRLRGDAIADAVHVVVWTTGRTWLRW